MNDPFKNGTLEKPVSDTQCYIDMDAPIQPAPMSVGKGLDLTVASKKDTFFKPGDPAINARNAAGPKGAMTMPGGNHGVSGGHSPSTAHDMQYAQEGNKKYAGKAVQGKVVRASGDSKLNKIYG